MPQVSVLSSTQDAARIKCSSLVRSNFVSRELLQRAAETFIYVVFLTLTNVVFSENLL